MEEAEICALETIAECDSVWESIGAHLEEVRHEFDSQLRQAQKKRTSEWWHLLTTGGPKAKVKTLFLEAYARDCFRELLMALPHCLPLTGRLVTQLVGNYTCLTRA